MLQGERELASGLPEPGALHDPDRAGARRACPRVEVTFLIDANGILNVTARDVRTGRERSVEVKPSYGLTDEEIERMLEESIDHAEDDVAARLLAEARIEAETLIRQTSARSRARARCSSPARRARSAPRSLRCSGGGGTDYNRIRDLATS